MKTTSENEHIERFRTEPGNYPVEAYFRRITADNHDDNLDCIENGYLLESENVIGKWAYDDGEFLVGQERLDSWIPLAHDDDSENRTSYISAVLKMLNEG